MKKTLAVIMAAVTVFGLCGCSGAGSKSDPVIFTLQEKTQADSQKATKESGTEILTNAPVTSAPTTPAPTTPAPTTPAPTTPAPTNPQETTAFVAQSPFSILNAAQFTPQKSGYPELDSLVDSFLAERITPGMSGYEKVWTIYKFFVLEITYNRPLGETPGVYAESTDKATTPEEVLHAIDIMRSRQGNCKNYAAGFLYTMRALGLEAHMYTGSVPAAKGGRTPHTWVELTINGQVYTFDPDIDKDLNNRGQGMETLFCRSKLDPNITYFYVTEKTHNI